MRYIGARYVVKIYENSLDPTSAEWEASVNYEPLTMVTYNNGSYLSKTTVPGSVGDPASNPSYWVQTGFYNGQIASLQNQIDTINGIIGDIDNLTTTDKSSVVNAINEIVSNIPTIPVNLPKKVLVISDSYTSVTSTGWDEVFESDRGITDFYNLRGSGYGFSRSGQQFIDLLTANAGSISDKDKFTDIIVGAGANDVGISLATLKSDISDFKTYCETNYPNAKLHIAFVSWSSNRSTGSSMRNICYHYRNACNSLGIDYLKGVEAAMHNVTFFNIADYPDEIHPNQDGNNAIGHSIAQAFEGHASVMYQETASFTPNTANVSSATTYLYNCFINDDVARIQTSDLNLTFVASHTKGEQVIIGTYSADTFKGNFSIPLVSLQGYTDYLFLNWNGTATIYLTHAVSANESIEYYYSPYLSYDVMQN